MDIGNSNSKKKEICDDEEEWMKMAQTGASEKESATKIDDECNLCQQMQKSEPATCNNNNNNNTNAAWGPVGTAEKDVGATDAGHQRKDDNDDDDEKIIKQRVKQAVELNPEKGQYIQELTEKDRTSSRAAADAEKLLKDDDGDDNDEIIKRRTAAAQEPGKEKYIPSGRRRTKRRSCPEGPGAFAVVSPRYIETDSFDSTLLFAEEEEPLSEMQQQSDDESSSSSVIQLEATLSPTDEANLAAHIDQGTGGGNCRTSRTSITIAATETLNSHLDVEEGFRRKDENEEVFEAKIVNVDEEEGQRPTWRWMLFAMILILLACVVTLGIGLAGRLRGGGGGGGGSSGSVEKSESAPLKTTPPHTSLPSLLEEIRERGYLKCHYADIPGFMSRDAATGQVTGFNNVWCQAVAAAIFGVDDLQSRIAYIDFYPLNMDVDISTVGVTPAMSRRVYWGPQHVGLSFSAPFSYDGMRFAGDPFFVECAQDKGFKHIEECQDLRVCVQAHTTHYTFVQSVLPERRIITFSEPQNVTQGFLMGQCNTLVVKQVMACESIYRELGYQGNFAAGDKLFSHEPWSVVIKKGDTRFANFVNAIVQSLLAAEQHNITQATAHLMSPTDVFGKDYTNMFQNAIAAVGNYGEAYDHFLSPILKRVPSDHINDGSTGLLFSYPFGRSHPPIESDDYNPIGPSLERILARGKLLCGVVYGRLGFAVRPLGDSANIGTGMDIDFCKAAASSLFGSPDALQVVPLEGQRDGFTKLANKEVDVVAGATWNLQNEVAELTTGMSFSFSQPYFYGPSDDDNLCMATLQDDREGNWATYIFWLVTATVYAEEQGINRTTFNDMPNVYSFGVGLQRFLKDAILAIGNYGEIYARNLESTIPRSGRNLLNSNLHGPQHYPMPGIVNCGN